MDSVDLHVYGCLPTSDCTLLEDIVDPTPEYAETLSAEVPLAFLPVFDAVATGDYDAPFPRCGAALRFLAAHHFITQQSKGPRPCTMTVLGQQLAKERGIIGLSGAAT
jgi:hypothetical protein